MTEHNPSEIANKGTTISKNYGTYRQLFVHLGYGDKNLAYSYMNNVPYMDMK